MSSATQILAHNAEVRPFAVPVGFTRFPGEISGSRATGSKMGTNGGRRLWRLCPQPFSKG